MSRKAKDSSALSDRFNEKVFRIKLRTTQEPGKKHDVEVVKAIEQEYATKYLESLGIEPNKGNIALVLKPNPLKDCDYQAIWNNSGRVADTLLVYPQKKKQKSGTETKQTEAEAEDEKLDKRLVESKSPELKLGKDDAKALGDSTKFGKGPQALKGKKPGVGATPGPESNQAPGLNTASGLKMLGLLDDPDAQKENENKFQLDYNIESIKSKYLYPFNENKQRKAYQNLVDDPGTSYLPPVEKSTNNDVLNSHKYYFPFSHVKVPSLVLKELQIPLKITTAEIVQELKKFVESFPFHVFPQQKTITESEATVSTFQTPPDSRVSEKVVIPMKIRVNSFLKDIDVERCKSILVTEELARIIGVVVHLSYWQVFGHLNPVQPDLITKKQMILISLEQINLLRKKVKNAKLWSLFILPMIVLTMRMMTEFILRNNYVAFFEIEKPCQIALEKVYMLITNMFDPSMLYSRLTFFESEIEAVKKKFSEHLDETKFRSKRIYGTNPYIDLYFPRPESDFVRNIRQKKSMTRNKKAEQIVENPEREAEGDNDTREKGPSENEYLHQSYKVKMFQVLLDKIDDNMAKKGKSRTSVLNFTKEKH